MSMEVTKLANMTFAEVFALAMVQCPKIYKEALQEAYNQVKDDKENEGVMWPLDTWGGTEQFDVNFCHDWEEDKPDGPPYLAIYERIGTTDDGYPEFDYTKIAWQWELGH